MKTGLIISYGSCKHIESDQKILGT